MNSEGFGLPEGYFGNAGKRLADRMAWMEEHREYPALAAIDRSQGFAVPADYFESDPLENVAYPVLAALRKTAPFETPHGYFGASEERLMAIGSGSLYPALTGAGKVVPFAVPDGYFEDARALLIEACRPQAKIFRIGIWLQAAAVLVLSIGLFTYRYYQQKDAAADCGGIACLDRHELLETKTLENAATEELYDLVNPEALREKLEGAQEKTPATDSSRQDYEDYLYDI
jgi:hypothetical protein